jgi:hypothetical protein
MNKGKQTHNVFAYKYFIIRRVSWDSIFSWRLAPGLQSFGGQTHSSFVDIDILEEPAALITWMK